MKFPITAEDIFYGTAWTKKERIEIVRRANAFDELLAFLNGSLFNDGWYERREALRAKYDVPSTEN